MDSRVIKKNDPIQNAVSSFSQKFPKTRKPTTDIPEVPRHLDDLSDEDLMDLYGAFVAWISYAKADLAQAEVIEEKAASECKLIEARVLIEQWGADAKGDRVTIAKARRDTDSRVVAAQQEHLETRAYRKLVEAIFDRCERSAQLLSRELSRRISDKPRDSKTTRFTT